MSNKRKKQTKKKEATPSLLKVIVIDVFFRNWLIVALATAVVISAMQKARTSHDARRATAKLQKLKNESQELRMKWQSLSLEMTALTESDRLTQIAEKKLKMIKVKTNNERIISF